MNEENDIIAAAVTNFTEMVTDPSRFLLVAGPLSVVVLLLIWILAMRAYRRRKESEEISAALKDQGEAAVAARTEEAAPDLAPESTTQPVVEAPLTEVDEIRRTSAQSWLEKLSAGLRSTRESLLSNLGGIFSGSTKINAELKERLHEILYRADLGVATANKLVNYVQTDVSRDETDWNEVKEILKNRTSQLLSAVEKPLNMPDSKPFVILIVGVNGVGKTTTTAKLAANFLAQDKSVLICAADTFRAAAIDQLKVWGERLGVDVIAHQQGSDPAAVAYDAMKAAIARGTDVLLVDTAGRLHSKKELMDELGKIGRVLGKDKPGAPHETWLVIDATTGQNALLQVKAFKEVVPLTGLVVTKLDGTAKGGVLIAAADQYGLPIRYIGVGEKAADLRPFSAEQYTFSLFGA